MYHRLTRWNCFKLLIIVSVLYEPSDYILLDYWAARKSSILVSGCAPTSHINFLCCWFSFRVITITGHARIVTRHSWAICSGAVTPTAEEGVASRTPYWTFGISSRGLARKRDDAKLLRKCTLRSFGRLEDRTLKEEITATALAHAQINMGVPLKIYSKQTCFEERCCPKRGWTSSCKASVFPFMTNWTNMCL